jgi:hypothetical protein
MSAGKPAQSVLMAGMPPAEAPITIIGRFIHFPGSMVGNDILESQVF